MFRKLVALLAICMLLAAGYGCGSGGSGAKGGSDDPYDIENLRRMRDAGEPLSERELEWVREADEAAAAGADAGASEPAETQ